MVEHDGAARGAHRRGRDGSGRPSAAVEATGEYGQRSRGDRSERGPEPRPKGLAALCRFGRPIMATRALNRRGSSFARERRKSR